MAKISTYKIPESSNIQTTVTEIANHFTFKKEPIFHQRQTFFDSFDWRLYSSGLFLNKEGNDYILNSLETFSLVEKATINSKIQPKFWWDFPESSLKEALKKQLDVRALIPLVEIENNILPIRILNADEKTVLKVQLENIFLIHENQKELLVDCIKLLPVRGYDEELVELKRWLDSIGISQGIKSVFFLALEAVGKTPGDYSSKLDFVLKPEMSARLATKVIFKFLLNIIKNNEQGVIADIDPEFLNDFRVAIRRPRSPLSGARLQSLQSTRQYLLEPPHSGASAPASGLPARRSGDLPRRSRGRRKRHGSHA